MDNQTIDNLIELRTLIDKAEGKARKASARNDHAAAAELLEASAHCLMRLAEWQCPEVFGPAQTTVHDDDSFIAGLLAHMREVVQRCA